MSGTCNSTTVPPDPPGPTVSVPRHFSARARRLSSPRPPTSSASSLMPRAVVAHAQHHLGVVDGDLDVDCRSRRHGGRRSTAPRERWLTNSSAMVSGTDVSTGPSNTTRGSKPSARAASRVTEMMRLRRLSSSSDAAAPDVEDDRADVTHRDVEFVDGRVDASARFGIEDQPGRALERQTAREQPLDHRVVQIAGDALLVFQQGHAVGLLASACLFEHDAGLRSRRLHDLDLGGGERRGVAVRGQPRAFRARCLQSRAGRRWRGRSGPIAPEAARRGSPRRRPREPRRCGSRGSRPEMLPHARSVRRADRVACSPSATSITIASPDASGSAMSPCRRARARARAGRRARGSRVRSVPRSEAVATSCIAASAASRRRPVSYKPCVLDRDAGRRGETEHELLVDVGEHLARSLVGEVQVAEHLVAHADGNAEERLHRWVIRREARRCRDARSGRRVAGVWRR